MNSYRTKDGRWFFFTGLEADRHIDRSCGALGRDGPARRPALRRRRGRSAGTATEVIAVLDEIIAERAARRLGRALRPRGRLVGAGAGSGRRPGRPAAGGQPTASSSSRDEADGTPQRSVNGPVSFSDVAGAARRAGPAPRASTPTRCWPSWRRGAWPERAAQA